ncbi:MAG: hypothetical protein DWI28_07060 [Planctomycetota bacterium]|nr:MAG: hypothetical protein DWI28_07060 [Planctomycetota bacterium]
MLRALGLSLFGGVTLLIGCYSSEYDSNTRKAKLMTELFDRDEKVLGAALNIGHVEFRENANISTAKLSLFLRAPKGILDKPGTGGKANKEGKNFPGKGQEAEIVNALSGGMDSATNTADAPYGYVFLLDPKIKASSNPRTDAMLVLFRREKSGESADITKAKMVADLARFRINKNIDFKIKELSTFVGNKKLEPTFKDWFPEPIKPIASDELYATSSVTLGDKRQAVWFTYLVPINQKKPQKFAGIMAVCYRVIRPPLGPDNKETTVAGGGTGKPSLEFDQKTGRYKPPVEILRSIENLRLDPDRDMAMELYNKRTGTAQAEAAPAPTAGSK